MSRPKRDLRASIETAFDSASTDRDGRAERIAELVRLSPRGVCARSDPFRSVTSKVGDRWNKLIIMILRCGRCRHAVLRRLASELADSQLSRQALSVKLRELESDGLVARIVIPSSPPQVLYELTALGEQLGEHIRTLLSWIEGAAPEILIAREFVRATDGPHDP